MAQRLLLLGGLTPVDQLILIMHDYLVILGLSHSAFQCARVVQRALPLLENQSTVLMPEVSRGFLHAVPLFWALCLKFTLGLIASLNGDHVL